MENTLIIIFAAVILIGILYQLISVYILKLEIEKTIPRISQNINSPSVSILKPIKGIDDQLESCLDSFFNLNYPNYEIIFGLHTHKDPALQIVNKLTKLYPKIRTKTVVNDFKIGLNPKINNMYNMYPDVTGEYILISDSNTKVESNFLTELQNEFGDKNTGLVSATIRGVGGKNFASLMENIHLNSFLSPSVFAASRIAKISIVIGKAILIPAALLERVGGFDAFKNYLAEDYLLGTKVEALGYKIKTSSNFVNNINEKWTLKKFLNRHSRWAKIRAKIRLNTYLLEAFSNPIAASTILALLIHNEIGIIQLAGVTLIKSTIDSFSLRLMKSDIKWYQLFIIPVKDLIIGLVWFVPFFNSEVTWRNNDFRILKDSLLKPIYTEEIV